jgi:hypothetical protein
VHEAANFGITSECVQIWFNITSESLQMSAASEAFPAHICSIVQLGLPECYNTLEKEEPGKTVQAPLCHSVGF